MRADSTHVTRRFICGIFDVASVLHVQQKLVLALEDLLAVAKVILDEIYYPNSGFMSPFVFSES